MRCCLIVVLLCIAALQTADSGVSPEDCDVGVRVFEMFVDRPCGVEPDPLTTLLQSPILTTPPLTVDTLRYFFTNYCSSVLPAVKQCFARRVQQCPNSQYLTTLAGHTGVLCQPYSKHLQPWVTTVLSMLRDDDLREDRGCWDKPAILSLCRQQARHSAIMAANMAPEVMRTAPVPRFLPFVQAYFSGLFDCLVREYREDLWRCRGWRWHALNSWVQFPDTGVTPFGLQLRLNSIQTALMFEIPV